MRFRTLANGDMVAIARGRPPAPPPGYYQDAKYPLLYHPSLEPCKHRQFVKKKKDCCNIFISALHCGIKSELITYPGLNIKEVPKCLRR